MNQNLIKINNNIFYTTFLTHYCPLAAILHIFANSVEGKANMKQKKTEVRAHMSLFGKMKVFSLQFC